MIVTITKLWAAWNGLLLYWARKNCRCPKSRHGTAQLVPELQGSCTAPWTQPVHTWLWCPFLSLRSSIAFQASVSTELTRSLVSAVRYHAQKTAAVQTSLGFLWPPPVSAFDSLDWLKEKCNRKPWFMPSDIGILCKCCLKPIQWLILLHHFLKSVFFFTWWHSPGRLDLLESANFVCVAARIIFKSLLEVQWKLGTHELYLDGLGKTCMYGMYVNPTWMSK